MLTGRVLLLNFSYEPLGTVGVARAVCLWFRGAVFVEENDGDNVLHSPSTTFPVPSVVRLRHYIHVRRNSRETTMKRARIYIRDRYRCQYCGRHAVELKPREALTRDHLIPLSRGGTNDWANVVTACSPCNTRKGNRLPEEIGMHPLTHPVEPHFVHLSWAVRRLTPTQARYIRTFYGDEVLHQIELLEHRGHAAAQVSAALGHSHHGGHGQRH